MRKDKNVVEKLSDVVIYVRYNDDNLDELKKKEEILMNYCKINNYNVIHKYFDNSGGCDQYFSNTMRNFLRNIGTSRFYVFVTCDIFELSNDINKIIALYTLLDDEDIVFETINQGEIGEDFWLEGNYTCNVLNKKELENPRIYYDGDGNVIDACEDIFSV